MNKQSEVGERTKSNLIQAFWKIFREKGLNKVNVKELTEVAGYNRCTFYAYFSDVAELLEDVEDVLLRDILTYLEKTIKLHDSKNMITNMAHAHKKYGNYLSLLLGPKGDPAFAEKYKNTYKPLVLQEFNFSQNDPRAEVLCEYVLGAITNSFIYWYNSEKPIEAEELATFLHELFEKGMGPLLKANR